MSRTPSTAWCTSADIDAPPPHGQDLHGARTPRRSAAHAAEIWSIRAKPGNESTARHEATSRCPSPRALRSPFTTAPAGRTSVSRPGRVCPGEGRRQTDGDQQQSLGYFLTYRTAFLIAGSSIEPVSAKDAVDSERSSVVAVTELTTTFSNVTAPADVALAAVTPAASATHASSFFAFSPFLIPISLSVVRPLWPRWEEHAAAA